MAKNNIPASEPAPKTRGRKKIEIGFSDHMTAYNILSSAMDNGSPALQQLLKPYLRNLQNRMKKWQRISYSEE